MSRGKFPERVIIQAKNEWRVSNPGREASLTVHHKCPVWRGRLHGIPFSLIKSLANAQALPEDEHQSLHDVTSPEDFDHECLALLLLEE
jgi:hypothetical protein